MTDIRSLAEQEAAGISRQLAVLQEEIDSSPAGHLKCNRWGDGRKSYYIVRTISGTRKARYIPPGELGLARRLALIEYCIRKRKILEDDLVLLRDLIDGFEPFPDHAASALMNPDHFSLISDTVFPSDDYVKAWMLEDYDRNPSRPEALLQKTLSGIRVRSKSEAIIADQLLLAHIPFRYEAGMTVGGRVVYPDFTILHPKTHERIIWEHFGLMSTASYRYNAFKKLAAYSDAGLELDKDLIATFEWDDSPLDPSYVSDLIRHYFER